MGTFRAQLAADIAGTFLNLEEFADSLRLRWRNVDVTAPAVLAGAVTGSALGLTDTADGLYLSEATLYVARDTLGGQPERGESLRVDGRVYQVQRSACEGGMLELGLTRVTEGR